MWYKIALDDIGWRDFTTWELWFADRDRIDEFLDQEVLDIIKLDMELVRELYLHSLWHEVDLSLIKRTYKLDNTDDVEVITKIWEYHASLNAIKPDLDIIAEWIEDVFYEKIDWKMQPVHTGINTDGFMRFLSQELWVTQFQWYALWKSMDPNYIK